MPLQENGAQELVLTEKAEWQFTDRELSFIDAFTTRSSRGNKVSFLQFFETALFV